MKVEARDRARKKPWWDAQADDTDRAEPSSPLVLVTHGAKGTRISALGSDGLALGLWRDMPLNDARAMLADIRVVTHDVVADRMLQNRLAHWLMRYSPCVALHGDDGFVLDIAGCAHLFGGEAAMAHDITRRLNAMGFDVRLAFADHVGAALALGSHGADTVQILPVDAVESALDLLPVDALRLDHETVTLLKRLGLKCIGDVRCLPRAALERRFRENKTTRSRRQASGLARSVQWRLDQLNGTVAEPLTWIKEPQSFRATRQCPALALDTGAVEIALRQLLPVLCGQLHYAGMGARQFRLTGYRADGGTGSISASLSQPVQDPDAVARLFKDRLERMDCGFGIDLFVLEALQTDCVGAVQHDGLNPDDAAFTSASIAAFADVLGNRGNGSRVMRLLPRQSHVPERAQRFVAVNTAVDWQAWSTVQPAWSPRPLRLLPRPETAQVTAELPDSPPVQFIWRKRLRKVLRARGPERVLPEWWHDDLKLKRSAVFRDYYDVEDESGLRYWMFRAIRDEPVDNSEETLRVIRWFVHGLF